MDNVYNEPGAQTQQRHLINNTEAELSAGLGTCQEGIATDTGRHTHKDHLGAFKKSALTTEIDYVKVSDTDDTPGRLNAKVVKKPSSAITVAVDASDDHLEIGVDGDDSTIETSSSKLRVKSGGITNTQVNAAAAIEESKVALTYKAKVDAAGAAGYLEDKLIENEEGGWVSITKSDDKLIFDTAIPEDTFASGGYFVRPVISIYDNTSALPPGPSGGDRYIALVTANGWTANHIYEWNLASWSEYTPSIGAILMNKTTKIKLYWDGTNWLQEAVKTHALGGSEHSADTITNLNTKLSDGDVISTKAAEISALTAKGTPTTSDLLIIEDAADSNNKKKITIASLPVVTPPAHASSHNAGGGDAMAIDAAAGTGSLRTLGTAATSACAGNDSRLSNSRTPTAHASTHNAGGGDAMAIDAAAGTGSLRTLGTGATAACAGNDSRLSDSRAPTAHAIGGSGHSADTIANLNGKLSDGDVLSTLGGEINALTEKTALAAADLFVIEDSAASNAKKKVQISTMAGNKWRLPKAYINTSGMTAAITISVARSDGVWNLTKVYAKRTGGTGATVNTNTGGAGNNRSTDLSLTTTSWTDFGTLQYGTTADGNDIQILIQSVAGSPTQIAFQLEFTKAV